MKIYRYAPDLVAMKEEFYMPDGSLWECELGRMWVEHENGRRYIDSEWILKHAKQVGRWLPEGQCAHSPS